MLLLGAGFETTVNLLGNGVVLLDQHRDQWDALIADPTGWDGAVEEVLRHDSPVQITGRIGEARRRRGRPRRPLRAPASRCCWARPTAIPRSSPTPPGSTWPGANARDHLAFSAGIHYCVGAGLARLEGVVGLRTLAERFPGLRVSGRPERRDLQTLRGFEHLPVTLR